MHRLKTIQRILVSLLAFTLVLTTFVTTPRVSADDLAGRALEAEMRNMIDRGILSGYEDGTYRPGELVTRGQFAAFIARALELEKTSGQFADVPTHTKLAKAIHQVKHAGIMDGYDGNLFKPEEYITREQVVLTIKNVLQYSGMDLTAKRIEFTDADQFRSATSLNAVFYATQYGIISGYENNDGTLRFEPKRQASREHAAAFISRFLDAKEGHAPEKPDTPKPEEPKPEEPKPTPPPAASTDYQLAKIQGQKIVKDTKGYPNYADAAKLFNDTSKGYDVMYRGNELVRIRSGIAYGDNYVTSASGKKVPAVTTVYESHTGKVFRNQVAYIEHGREMRYIDANADAVKVQVGATIGWVKHSEVDFIPLSLLKNREYYTKNTYGTLTHYVYNHRTKTGSSYTIGPAPDKLKVGERYYSYDGVHFSDKNGRLIATDYSYFQFLSARAKTNYTAKELDQHIVDRLKSIEATGNAKYKNATKNSKLRGTGKYMVEMQEKHRVNALFILAAAIHESDYGMSANAQQKNNLFGIRVYDSSPESGVKFAKPEDSIQSFVLDYMNKNYIPPQALHANGAAPGNKTSGFNVKYASDPNWGSKIAGHMFRIDIALGNKDIHKEKLIMTSHAGNINVRSAPDTSKNNTIYQYAPRSLGYAGDMGNPLVVLDEKKGADGYLWYKVASDHVGHKEGWVRSDLVRVISEKR